jgi:hypothetical protein
MSTDPNAQGPYAPDVPPRKSGGSGIWLFLGIGCGLVLLLCCGGGVAMFYVGKSAINVTQVPAEVTQKSQEIADFDVPAGFKPQMAMSTQVPFTGQKFMTMVVYSAPNQDGGLFLMEFGGAVGANMDREQLKLQMHQSLSQQGQQAKQLNILESRDVEVQIHGQPTTFKIQKAEDQQTKQQYVQVEGTFNGKGGGPAVLIGQLKADEFSEDDAEKLVRSIK